MENKEQQDLLMELMAIEVMVKENPCKVKCGVLASLKEVIPTFIGNHCMSGATREQVAKYFGRDVRTISHWREKYFCERLVTMAAISEHTGSASTVMSAKVKLVKNIIIITPIMVTTAAINCVMDKCRFLAILSISLVMRESTSPFEFLSK